MEFCKQNKVVSHGDHPCGCRTLDFRYQVAVYSCTIELPIALVSGFSLPGNEKPLTADQACWHLDERFRYEESEYGNIMLILVAILSPFSAWTAWKIEVK